MGLSGGTFTQLLKPAYSLAVLRLNMVEESLQTPLVSYLQCFPTSASLFPTLTSGEYPHSGFFF